MTTLGDAFSTAETMARGGASSSAIGTATGLNTKTVACIVSRVTGRGDFSNLKRNRLDDEERRLAKAILETPAAEEIA